MYYDGQWGTICNDLWNDEDATIVCRQLELSDQGILVFQAAFGRGSGTVWLDNVEYNRTENSLQECSHPGWVHTIVIIQKIRVFIASMMEVNGT